MDRCNWISFTHEKDYEPKEPFFVMSCICNDLQNFKVFSNNENTEFLIKLIEYVSVHDKSKRLYFFDSERFEDWSYDYGYSSNRELQNIFEDPLFECTNIVKRKCDVHMKFILKNEHDTNQRCIDIKRNCDGQAYAVLGPSKKTVYDVQS